MIPVHIARTFDVLGALASGDLAAVARVATPKLGERLDSLLADGSWREAAQAWVASSDRSVMGRTDGRRTLVRFQRRRHEAWVLEYDAARVAGLTVMANDDFEGFGSPV